MNKEERRHEQVGKLLHRTVANILENLTAENGVFVTVQSALISPTREHAKIFVSIYPKEKTEQMLDFLEKNVRFVQQELNKKLVMRPVPKITFEIDTSQEKAERIRHLIDEANK